MKAIIATNNLGFIGIGDRLLWHNPDDLKHFKELTLNSKLLVGYRTYQSLPVLKDRELIVDIRDNINLNVDWCIGGKNTYEKYCMYFNELHISHIDNNSIGDVTFPDLTNLNPNCKIYNYYFF
jgi:dihydrofolate reductase